MDTPCASLNPARAARLGLAEGELIELQSESGLHLRLPLKLDAALVDGLLALPAGFPNIGLLAAEQTTQIQAAAQIEEALS